MVVLLDPADCYRDSPRLRADMALAEQSTERFAEALKKVVLIGRKVMDVEKGLVLF